MKKVIYLCSFLLLFGVMSCSDIDNRDAPEETLQGVLIDAVTKKPLITEQPNGFRIQLMEYSWSDNPTPLYFWGKADGSFTNTKLFAGKYGVKPIEGAFFEVEEQIVDISGTTTVNFEVIPYLSISKPEIKVLNSSSIEVSYKLSRHTVGPKIMDTRVFISEKTPLVGANILNDDFSPMINLEDVDDEEALDRTYVHVIENLDPSKAYHMRVGARVKNNQNRYNFTEIVKLDLK